jgi:uncharacterized protein (DUF488 family)
MAYPFFTIGHSTHPLGKFIELLTASEIGIVIDVRTILRSRTNPQFNREALPGSLSDFQIAYEHIAELGGRARRQSGGGATAESSRTTCSSPASGCFIYLGRARVRRQP